MSLHDEAGNKKLEAGSKKNPVDPAETEKRSWLHRRTSELVLESHPDGNGFTQEFWSKCYKQAKEEWGERQPQMDRPQEDG